MYSLNARVVYSGPIIKKNFSVIMKNGLLSGVGKLAEIGKNAAIEDYRGKRSPKNPQYSRIIESFKHILESLSVFEARARIFAGSPAAYYVRYVEYGHHTFPGYHFMKHGADVIHKNAKRVMNDTLRLYLSGKGGVEALL